MSNDERSDRMVRTKKKILAQSLKETVTFYNDVRAFDGNADGVREKLANLYSILEEFSFAKYYEFYGANHGALKHCLDVTVNSGKFSGEDKIMKPIF